MRDFNVIIYTANLGPYVEKRYFMYPTDVLTEEAAKRMVQTGTGEKDLYGFDLSENQKNLLKEFFDYLIANKVIKGELVDLRKKDEIKTTIIDYKARLKPTTVGTSMLVRNKNRIKIAYRTAHTKDSINSITIDDITREEWFRDLRECDSSYYHSPYYIDDRANSFQKWSKYMNMEFETRYLKSRSKK